MEIENGFVIVEMTAKVAVAASSNLSDKTQNIVKRCVLELDITDNDPRMVEPEDEWQTSRHDYWPMEESCASMVNDEYGYQGVPNLIEN